MRNFTFRKFNSVKLIFLVLIFFISSQTRAQFPYSQSFKNSTAPGVLFGGSPVAFLTGGFGAKDGYNDANGSGYLRLTNNQGNQKGIVYSDAYSFPSAYGMTISFEYYTHSTTSGSGADGIAFILFDATASPVAVGAFGGSLGYAQRNTETGFSKGYLGIGIDEYGNFSAANEGKTGGVGVLSSNVTLRGAGTGTTGYRHLISSQTTALASPFNVAGNVRTDTDNTKAGFRKMEVVLKPNSGGGFIINVYLTHGSVRDRIISDYAYTDIAPANLKFAISSSTGGSNNFHEIRNLNITVDEATLLTPVANPDEFTACAGSTAISGDITANDNGSVNTLGTINKSTIDLDPATAGIQTTYTVTNKGTFTYDSATGRVTFVPLNNTVVGPIEIDYTFKDNYNKTSNSTKLTYKTYNVITNNVITAPSPSTFCDSPRDPGIITGSAAAVSGGTITYQWESSSDNISFNPISVTTASYDPPVTSTTTYYRRIASSANCKDTSNVVAIIFGGASTPTATAATAITCNSFTANWNSVSNATSYGILVSKNSDFSNPELPFDGRNLNSSNTSINITGLTSGVTYYYKLKAFNSCGEGANYSNVITTVVGSGSVAGTISSAQTICSGSSPADLTLTGYTGSIQWQYSTDNNTFFDISAATSPTLTSAQMGIRTANTYYRAVVKSGTCTAANTASVLITVSPPPTLSGASQITSPVCAGSTTRISLTGLVSNSTSTISYSIDGIPQTPVTGVVATGTTANFETVVLTAANNGKVLKITGITTTSTTPNCSAVVDVDVILNVNAQSVGGTVASAQSICAGTSPNDLVLSGNTGNVTKWQKASNSTFTSPTDIASTSTTLTKAIIGNLSSNTYFRAVVQNGVCSAAFSGSVLITVTTPPNAGTLSGSQNICVSGSTTFNSSGNTGGSWSTSDVNIATVNSSGVIAGVGAGTATITYTVTGTGGCSNASATRTVTVTTPPNAGTLSGQQIICAGGSTTFTSSSNEVGSWSSNNTSVATVNTSGVISAIAAGTATITYRVAGNGGCSDATAIRTVTVNALPTATITGTLNACLTTTLNAVTNAASPTYVWYRNNVALSGETASTLVVNQDGDYKVKIRNSSTNCEDTSAPSTVKVSDTQKPTITCPANVTKNTDANSCTASGVVLGTPVTADNCGVASVTNNAPGSFPIGVTTVTWTVTDTSGNTETCTQTVKIIGPIKAENDLVSSFNGLVGGTAIATVLDNDFLNCNKAVQNDVNISVSGTLPAALNFNTTTGAVSVNANTPTGTYTFNYEICEKANTNNCNIATVTIQVVNALVANADNTYAAQMSGTTSVNVGNVTSNDTLNGQAVTASNTDVDPATSGPLSIDADGELTLAANTPSGTYTINYNICETGANPSNCKTATAEVKVVNGLVANADNTYAAQTSGTTAVNVGNVTSNDTLNGQAVTASNTNVDAVTSGPLSINADGELTLAANTPSGSYTINYNICETGANPSNCKTATATVEVVNGLVANADNTYAIQTSGTTSVNVGNVTSNDTLNGQAVTASNTDVDPVTSGPLSINADGELTLAANTPSGTYTINYNICEKGANPSNCKTATATVEVVNGLVANADNTYAAQTSGTTSVNVGNVTSNDTLNGQAVTASNTDVDPATSGPLSIDADGELTLAANTPSGTYTINYNICETGANPSNCKTATAEVKVVNGLVANADNTYAAQTSGTTAVNVGNVTSNDTLNGQAVTASNTNVDAVTSGPLSINADGELTLAANTPSGSYTINYNICETGANPSNCKTATATVEVVNGLVANADNTFAVQTSGTTAVNVGNVTSNDTLNGQAVTASNTDVDPVTSGPLSIDADGELTLAANTPSGTYTINYNICEKGANSSNCKTATATVEVLNGLVANADNTYAAQTSGTTAVNVGNVTSNDTLNGQAVTASNTDVDPVTSGPLSINADGELTLAANTASGTYTINYNICETGANPSNCKTATAEVKVVNGLVANADNTYAAQTSGTTSVNVGNVTSNDTLNGQAVTASNTDVDPVTSGPLSINADGELTLAANTASGTYTINYNICETGANPSNCKTATATVEVKNEIKALVDTISSINGNIGGTTISLVDNDTLNGSPVSIGTNPTNVNINIVGTLPTGLTLNANGTITVAPNTPAANYNIEYTICEVGSNPSNCDTVTIVIPVTAGTLIANADSIPSVTGSNTTQNLGVNVFDNDTKNGQKLDPSDVNLTVEKADPTGYLVLNPDGTLTLGANAPAGNYELTYTICEKLNLNNCSSNTVTLTVTKPVIDAVEDTITPISGNTGGTTISLITNDTLNGSPVVMGTNPGEVNFTLVGTLPTGLTLNADYTITVAPNTPAANYDVKYTICDNTNSGNCDTVTIVIPVTAGTLIANADSIPSVTGSNSAQNLGVNVFDNDTKNGQKLDPSDVNLTVEKADPTGYLVLNPDGTLTLGANAPAGNYELTYTICEKLNSNNCSSNTVTLTVTKPVIDAVEDTITPISGNTGGTTISLITNDTLNGSPVVMGTNPGEVTFTLVGTLPAGLTLNADYSITVAPNTPAANYDVKYTICDNTNSGNCDTVTIVITVTAGTLVANADPIPAITVSGKAQNLGVNVFDNDTKNGQKLNPSDVNLTVEKADPTGYLVLNPDGTLTLGANAPAGNYELTYTICEKLNLNNCSQAIVKVTVQNTANPGAPTAQLVLVNDNINADGINGSLEFINVLANDLLNGQPINLSDVTVKPVTTNAYFEWNADGTVSVKPNTPGGNYPLTYQVCEKVNGENCATAVLNVFVEVPAISVIKTAVFNDENNSGFANAGETITYKFKVTNTGNVALKGITLSDPLPGVIVSGQTIDLAVNESNETNFTAVYKVTQEDINRGNVSNQASVKGNSLSGIVVEDKSDDSSNDGDNPTVIDLNGCAIKVFNAFSPNGDQKNSRFYIRGIECYPDNTVEIYNRWGVLVFSVDEYNNSDRVFLGYSNGRSTIKQTDGLPVGTYFYILKYKDTAKAPHEESGYLYINK